MSMQPRRPIHSGAAAVRCGIARAAVTVSCLASFLEVVAAASAAENVGQATPRMKELNESFLRHLDSLSAEHAQAVELLRRSFRDDYADQAAEGFVPDALAVLYPAFRAGLDAFEQEDYAAAARVFGELLNHADPFVAANAAYYHARSLVERGLLEEAEAALLRATDSAHSIDARTPYAPHLWFLRGYCESSNLRFDEALTSLRHLADRYADAPEAIRAGGRQLLLEVERRDSTELGQATRLMVYSAQRLRAADAAERTRQRQQEIVDLLDKLIRKAEEQEQQCAGGSPGRTPARPAEQSRSAPGQAAGDHRDLHSAPPANPGEQWGQLPPAEREKILQSLRERFPSRYRQLVEQYYRSLAEQE